MRIIKNNLFLFLLVATIFSCKKDDDSGNGNEQPGLSDILKQENLNLYLESLEKSVLIDSLKKANHTLFAPTDSAILNYISSVGADSLESFQDLVGENRFRQIFQYHWLESKVKAKDLGMGYQKSASFSNQNAKMSLHFLNEDGTVVINKTSEIIDKNIEAENGFIHIINRVLTPPTLQNFLRQNSNLSEFIKLIQLSNSNLEAVLNQTQQGFTVFAPSNSALQNFLQKENYADLKDFVNTVGQDTVQAFLNGHVLEEAVSETELVSGNFKTINGNSIFTALDGDGEISLSETAGGAVLATVSDEGINGVNGGLYILDGVLAP